MKNSKDQLTFIWRIASSHMIAYFVAGLFAVIVMNYKEHYASQSLSLLMRPVDSVWVALGPSLQIIRGIILALILLPLRNIFVNERYGVLKLALLILGLSYISTIGPAPGSFEGYVYTILPIQYHLLGIPEAIIYIFLFSLFIQIWYKEPKPVYKIISIVFVLLIFLMSTLGMLKAMGILKV